MATAYETGGAGTYKEAFYWPHASWGAIFSGVVVALVVQLLLSLLGMAVSPAAGSAATLGIGLGIWFIVVSVIAMFAGGWVAAHLSGTGDRVSGLLHGLIVWGFSSLLAFYLMTSAVGSLISGVAGVIGKGLSGVTAGAVISMPAGTAGGMDRVLQEARRTLGITTPGGPEAQRVEGALGNLVTGGGSISSTDREAIIGALTANGKMNRTEATRTLDGWIAEITQMRQTTAGAAQTVTSTLSKAAIFGFIALLLGGIAGSAGGWTGISRAAEEAAARFEERERGRKTAA